MKITFIGYGNVGGALAAGLADAGHEVSICTDDPASSRTAALLERCPEIRAAPAEEALPAAEVVMLATPFGAVEDVIAARGALLGGRVLVDCTNPVGPGITHGLGSTRSGTEMIQERLPDARVVKCFSVYGFENLANPGFPGYEVKPAMPLCGNDADAKAVVSGLAADLGWQPLDVGGAEQALHLEHMTLLWVRMVRVNGHSPHFVWAALEGPPPT